MLEATDLGQRVAKLRWLPKRSFNQKRSYPVCLDLPTFSSKDHNFFRSLVYQYLGSPINMKTI
jgi:hypothetical protein